MPSTRSMKSAAQPPSSRMSLRSLRSVSMSSCSSSSASASDDSCDSFGSDGGFASTRSNLRPAKRMTPPKVFKSPTEEACSAFETAISTSMGAMKVRSEPRRATRKATPLKVAMVFPARKTAPKRAAPEEEEEEEEEEEGEGENFLDKRAINIKENKEMLAKLMAEINKVPGLFPRRMAVSLPSTPRRAHKAPGVRKRQQASSRPQTRSRARGDRPSPPTPDNHNEEEEEDDEEEQDQLSLVRRSRYYEPATARRALYSGALTTAHEVRPVEDVTETELSRICTNVKEKVYNRLTGTTCHQCRQKTTDTKTCCRNPECVGVRGKFCGPCLRNRYGEEVRAALLDSEWQCPPCRGICNCSFCRARDGRCATGVLVYLAQFHGYDNAHAYLKSLKKKLEEDSE
ncbi:unnamed protein product [Arctogadus glacialis]